MNIDNDNKISINNLVSALLFLVLGIILLTTKENIITILSKIIGGILILAGVIKSITYIYMKGKLGKYNVGELIFGLILICIGVLFILFSSTLGIAIRLLVGVWALFAGINKTILAISMKTISRTGFRMYLVSAMLIILVGVVLISGAFSKFVGLFIIIYAVCEIVDYIYYMSSKKEVTSSKKSVVKKSKKIKNSKVMDAIIEDEKKEYKKDKNS